MRMSGWETQLRKGVVDLAVLATIGRGETYGYHIVGAASSTSRAGTHGEHGLSGVDPSARDGLLAIRSAESPAGPPRRYYRLTIEGERHFRRMAESWRKVSNSLSELIEGAQR